MYYSPAPRPAATWVKDQFGTHWLMDGDTKVAKVSKIGWSVPSKTEKDTWHVLDMNEVLDAAAKRPDAATIKIEDIPPWHEIREGVEVSRDGSQYRFWSNGRWITVW